MPCPNCHTSSAPYTVESHQCCPECNHIYNCPDTHAAATSEEIDGSNVCTSCGRVLDQIFVHEAPNPKDSVGGSGNYGELQK